MARASRPNGALWACALVVVVTTPSPGSSQRDNATFTVTPNVLNLGRGRHSAPFTLDCSHPPGASGSSKRLEVHRKVAADASAEFQLIAQMFSGFVSAMSARDEFHFSGNLDHIYLKKDQGDCREERFLYQCRSFIDGMQKHRDLKVEFLVIPKALLTVSPSHWLSMRAGVMYTITCEALGRQAPQLKWSVFVQGAYLDVTPEMFAYTSSGTTSVTECLIKSASYFNTDAESVYSKLKTCNLLVKCQADPLGKYATVGSDTKNLHLQNSQCQAPVPQPDDNPEITTLTANNSVADVTSPDKPHREAASQESRITLLATLSAVLCGLFLLLVGMVTLAFHKRKQQRRDKAEVVRRLSQLQSDRRRSSMPGLLELEVMGPRSGTTQTSTIQSQGTSWTSLPDTLATDPDTSSAMTESSTGFESLVDYPPVRVVRPKSAVESETPGIWYRASAQVY